MKSFLHHALYDTNLLSPFDIILRCHEAAFLDFCIIGSYPTQFSSDSRVNRRLSPSATPGALCPSALHRSPAPLKSDARWNKALSPDLQGASRELRRETRTHSCHNEYKPNTSGNISFIWKKGLMTRRRSRLQQHFHQSTKRADLEYWVITSLI